MASHKFTASWDLINEDDPDKNCEVKIHKVELDFSEHALFHLLEVLVEEEPSMKQVFINFAKNLVAEDLLGELKQEADDIRLKTKGKHEN